MAKTKAYLERNTLAQAAIETFGGTPTDLDPALRAAKRERIEMLAISDVYPDRRQPRRAVPNIVMMQAQAWGADVLATWTQMAAQEMGAALDVAALLTSDDDPDVPPGGPVSRALLELVNLARRIRIEGLINPITASKTATGQYLIETGERRWWAFHLLAAIEGESWQKIPARIVEQPDVWRQASENGARVNLTAIGRARQYALLMMALYADRAFLPYEAAASDRAFYAQVAELRVPRGKAADVCAAMGITERSILVHYRKLLTIDDSLWLRADDEGTSIRELLNAFNNSGEMPSPPTPLPNAEYGRERGAESVEGDEDGRAVARPYGDGESTEADSPTAEIDSEDAENAAENEYFDVIRAGITEKSEAGESVVQLRLWDEQYERTWTRSANRIANAMKGALKLSRDEVRSEIARLRQMADEAERVLMGGG